MKKIGKLVMVALVFGLGMVSCTEQHLISDGAERRAVQEDFEVRKSEFSQTPCFDLLSSDTVSAVEKESLTFLFAYMPISDLAGLPGEYHLMNVRYALKAREEMPWGERVPEREFRHFVLPYRVNNENLDDARKVFYEELKPRVQHLSLHDAVLEVNHWCHEKVVYRPSDARTSSPLASVKTAYGRCGEESTFLVAALRSVGIPARQVYTPRWAHTDDNHAWVEAWVDGRWHFMGACEPEPVLDLGWFNAPAARGMLMHTRVFGHYNGPEEVIKVTSNYTEINVADNYADAVKGEVKVVDAEGSPVDSAKVEFKIYNYAEFYTAVVKYTDKDGFCSLTAGQGDMLVWASKNGRFGYRKLSFGKDGSIEVRLDGQEGDIHSLSMDIVPPVEKAVSVTVTPEQRADNDVRMAREDSIREAYVATFPTEEYAKQFAVEVGLDASEMFELLQKSRGNYAEIEQFIRMASPARRVKAMRLLRFIAEKDLRDTPASVLADHLNYTPDGTSPLYDAYVLNARVSTELLTPYKSYLSKAMGDELSNQFKSNPASLIKWCVDNLVLHDEWNANGVVMSPRSVWESRVTDSRSRDVFFVAVLRTLGIPARVDMVTGKLQYAGVDNEWVDVHFDAEVQRNAPQGRLVATYNPVKALENPLYYTHFTLSRFHDGTFYLMSFDEDGESNWKNLFSTPHTLDVGYYMLTTGTRLASGSVLSNVSFFNIKEEETTEIDLVMRDNPDDVKIIGSLNAENLFLPKGKEAKQSLLSVTGRGYYIVGILGCGQEPTNHALRDIAALGKDFEQWGRSMVLLFPDKAMQEKFNAADFPGLPSTITWGVDEDGCIQKEIVENLHLMSASQLPVFVIADTFNRVVFVSQGYTIGLGDQLMKVIHKL